MVDRLIQAGSSTPMGGAATVEIPDGRREAARSRRAHLLAAAIILLILGVYATVYAQSDAPPVGLAAIATGALVPMAAIAVLAMPRIAAPFREEARPITPTATILADREIAPPRLALGLALGLYMIVALAIVFIASGPVAIQLRMALSPAP